jgi:hypothetical protein
MSKSKWQKAAVSSPLFAGAAWRSEIRKMSKSKNKTKKQSRG